MGTQGKDRIIQAALELIAGEGIAALTNRAVARRAAVSLGSLTYHFPSQADLLRECLDAHLRERVEWIEAAAKELRQRRLGSSELGIEIERLSAAAAGGPGFITELEIHLHAARHPLLQEASRRCFLAYEAFASTAMERLRIPDPERHAAHVVALMLGVGLRGRSTSRPADGGLAEALQTIARGAAALEQEGKKTTK